MEEIGGDDAFVAAEHNVAVGKVGKVRLDPLVFFVERVGNSMAAVAMKTS